MKLLHTSDWHLGRSLYGKKRYDEFAAFLDWLVTTIKRERIDVLLVAGDVFDNSTPGTRAQEHYYSFLCNAATAGCSHVVVVAGNHDSPSFLDAPKAVLRALNVHVIGTMMQPEEEVLVLDIASIDNATAPETAIICAVPYLRDTDIRSVAAGESIDDKQDKLSTGIRQHYAQVCAVAEKKRAELLEHRGHQSTRHIPIIAMGHLFTTGGVTVDGDGVRELYVGSLAHTGSDAFPPCIDYLALGHLHVPQIIDGKAAMRYSGSPLPMGFSEAQQEKSVVIVDFCESAPVISLVPVPAFRKLVQLRGSAEYLRAALATLVAQEEPVWVDIIYEGDAVAGALREELELLVKGSCLELLRIRNNRIINRVLQRASSAESFDTIDPYEVFRRCLTINNIPEEQQQELCRSYHEIMHGFHAVDVAADEIGESVPLP